MISIPKGIVEPEQQYAYVEKKFEEPAAMTPATGKQKKKDRLLICSCGFSCSHLEQKAFSAHMKIHDEEAPKEYPCTHCDMVFRTTRLQRAHIQNIHPRAYKCGICNMVIGSLPLFKIHRKEKHTKHICRLCRKKFETSDLLLEHRKIIHKRNFCKICKLYLVGEMLFQEHNILHSWEGPPFVCEMCGMVFKRRGKLKAHKERHARNDKYTCDVCSFATFEKVRFRNHVNRSHILSKDFVCDTCDKKFALRESLIMHLKTHEEKKHMCEKCPQAFNSIYKFNLHQKIHDPNRDRFQCEVCGQSFAVRHGLLHHLESHFEKEKYKCEFCGKVVTSSSSLQIHRRRHTGERPFSCKICPKTFIAANYLRSHMLVHTGVKRHECQQCGKRFAQRSSYTLHMKYHSGLKPFACEVCPKAFITKPLLAAHEKIHDT